MNSRFLFCLTVAFVFSISLPAQIKLVGTHYDANSGITSVLRWDVTTGAVLDSVPTTQQGTVIGSSVFDAYNGRYYFNGPQNMVRIGFNPSSYEVLGTWAMASGTEIDMANGKIFGVQSQSFFDSLGGYIGSEIEFIQYTIADSTDSILGIFPSLFGYVVDASCFNSNSGTYYFLAVDTNNVKCLVSVSTRGAGFSPSIIPLNFANGNITTLEYDNAHNQLFALSRTTSPASHLQIYALDTLSAFATLEADFPQFTGYQISTSAFDQATGSMMFVAVDTNSVTDVHVYATQAHLLNVGFLPLNGHINEFECDNTEFAGLKYGQANALVAPNNDQGLRLYPNPANDVIRILTAGTIAEVHVVDAMGKSLPLSISADSNTIDVSALSAGCYLLRAQLQNGLWTQSKFIKR